MQKFANGKKKWNKQCSEKQYLDGTHAMPSAKLGRGGTHWILRLKIKIMNKEWREILNGRYSVSNDGEVYSRKINGLLKPHLNHKGYPKVALRCDEKRKAWFVHRLVMNTFVGEIPTGYVVNHKNGNKQDNRLINLEYVTLAENAHHAMFVLKTVHSRLNIPQVRVIKYLLAQNLKQQTIANIFNVDCSSINGIAKGRDWKSI